MVGRDAAGAIVGAQDAPVLVVDPDVHQRRLVAAALGRAGFRAKLVASGGQAIEEARRERPQLVILEVRLDDISGYEVCRALREEFGEALGIIFVSGDRKEASDRVARLLIGAGDYPGTPVAEGASSPGQGARPPHRRPRQSWLSSCSFSKRRCVY